MSTASIIEIKVNEGTSISGGGSGGAGGSGGSGAGMLAAGGKLGIIAGAMMAVVSILKDMLWVFKPVMNVLKAIGRTIGMFLQPIAQMIFLLLQPLLAFLRPAAMLFRAIMAPVMSMMREYSNVMTAQIAGGDTQGAMQTGTDMVGLALSGFFIALADIVGTMLINVLGSLLSTVTTGLIDLVTILLVPLFGTIDALFRTNLVGQLLESADNLKTNVAASFEEGIAYATDALHNGSQIMMEGLIDIHRTNLDNLKETVGVTFPEAIQPFNDVIANTSESTAVQVQDMQTKTNTSLTTMGSDVDNYMDLFGNKSIPATFAGGLGTMKRAMDDFATAAQQAGSRISSALRSAQSESRKVKVLGMTVATIE